MKMIPPTIDPETPSEGERFVFEQLAADASHPDWVVLHSLDIARHRRQMEGEIDFLIVAPGLGVLVLEVKGCRRLKRERGLWFYGGDFEGHEHSPFSQASEAMHSVKDRVFRKHLDLEGVLCWSAACFPFIEFTDESEEWTPWQVVDKVKVDQRSVAECAESVLEQARRRAAELRLVWFDERAAEPTADQCERIVQMLRPDFEFFESPKARSKRVDEEIRHYTEEQFGALDSMRRVSRVVFDGPAGTGKTLLALEAARRGHAAGKSVLILCFNRPLSLWLQDQAQELLGAGRAPTVVIKTIHQHMTDLAGQSVRGRPGDGPSYWDKALPDAAAERLLENWEALEKAEKDNPALAAIGPTFGVFDELIVDEAQDVLRDAYLEVLDLSVRGGVAKGTWRMFGDFSWQTIYDDTVSLDRFCELRGGNCPQIPLDENCRNTPRVAELACAAGGVQPGYSKVLRPDDGVDPEVCYFGDGEAQRKRLTAALEELYAAGFTGPQVAVLSMHRDDRAVASTVFDLPWKDRLEPLVSDGAQGGCVNLHTGRTHYSSIYRFKGLEARAVVLTDIDELSSDRDRSLVYVGATRATHRLVVLAHESLRSSFA